MSLFKKILFPIIVIILIMQMLMSFFIISLLNKSAEEETYSSMRNNSTIIERSFDQLINDYSVIASTLIMNQDILKYLDNPDTSDVEILDNTLRAISDAKNASLLLNNIFVMPADGITRMNVLEGYNQKRHDHTSRYSYQEIIANPGVEIYIERPKAAVVNNRAIFNIYALREEEGLFKGAVGLPLSMHNYIKEVILTAVTDQEIQVYLVDGSGNILGAADETVIYNEAYNLLETEPVLYEEMLLNKQGFREYTYGGIDSWVNYSYIDLLDTYILLTKDITAYKNAQVMMIVASAFISVVIVLIVLGIIYVVIKRVTSPIEKIVAFSRKVSNREFDLQLDQATLERKDEIGVLGLAFQHMLQHLDESFIELEKKTKEIQYLAFHDPLTQLSNRRYFRKALGHVMDQGGNGSVIMLDIDNFKFVNDTLGHIVGDKILCQVADILLALSDEGMVVTRFGGDEFILWISDSRDWLKTEAYIERLNERMKEPLYVGNVKVEVSFSIGISKYPEDSRDLDILVRYSDLALYEVKKHGKKAFMYFDESMEKEMLNKSMVEEVIAEALIEDSFYMLYQPQVSLETGEVKCFEALLRLKDHSYGPGEFIPIAEESGQIVDIGRVVVDKVFSQLAKWRAQGQAIKPVSLNYSVMQIQDVGFVDYVFERLDHYDLKPEWLEFEVTENIFIEHLDEAVTLFDRLKAAGITTSVDDFGTGYSSLTYVINLPINKIKLDRSICQVLLTEGKINVMKSLIHLAHSIELDVVAEGIERLDHVDKLKKIHCDAIQGFYFSQPLPPSQAFDVKDYGLSD